jgi:hypothetical protein
MLLISAPAINFAKCLLTFIIKYAVGGIAMGKTNLFYAAFL